jgi:hypothetical protein
MLVDLLAHGILHEITAVTVVVSRHFKRLENELAECVMGMKLVPSLPSLNQCHIIKNADVSW